MIFDQIVVISNKHSIYELPHELRNKFRLKKLGNIKKISKPLSIMELYLVLSLPPKMKILSILAKNL